MARARRSETIETHHGAVEIEEVAPLAGGGARVDVDVAGGPRWRLDVSRSGDHEVVTSWNDAGELADVDVPEWIEDVLLRLK